MGRRNKNWKGNGWNYNDRKRRVKNLGPKPKRSVKCGKRKYNSRMDAMLALANTQGYRSTNKRDEKRVYKCPDCGGWHLTSMSLGKYKRIEAWREKKKTTDAINKIHNAPVGKQTEITQTTDTVDNGSNQLAAPSREVNSAFGEILKNDADGYFTKAMSYLGKVAAKETKLMKLSRKMMVVTARTHCDDDVFKNRWTWFYLAKMLRGLFKDARKIIVFDDVESFIDDTVLRLESYYDSYEVPDTGEPPFDNVEWATACRWAIDDPITVNGLLTGFISPPDDWCVCFILSEIERLEPGLLESLNHDGSSKEVHGQHAGLRSMSILERPNPFIKPIASKVNAVMASIHAAALKSRSISSVVVYEGQKAGVGSVDTMEASAGDSEGISRKQPSSNLETGEKNALPEKSAFDTAVERMAHRETPPPPPAVPTPASVFGKRSTKID